MEVFKVERFYQEDGEGESEDQEMFFEIFDEFKTRILELEEEEKEEKSPKVIECKIWCQYYKLL